MNKEQFLDIFEKAWLSYSIGNPSRKANLDIAYRVALEVAHKPNITEDDITVVTESMDSLIGEISFLSAVQPHVDFVGGQFVRLPQGAAQ